MRWLWPEAGVSCAVPGGPCPARVGAAGWSPAGLGAVGCPALGQPGHPGAKVLWRGAGAGAASAVLPLLLVLKHLVPFGLCTISLVFDCTGGEWGRAVPDPLRAEIETSPAGFYAKHLWLKSS